MLSTHPTTSTLTETKEIKTSTPSMLSTSLPTESSGLPIKFTQSVFRNWGGSIESSPAYTFFPKTKIGIRNIVTWANALKKNIRVVGYRHTWTSLYPEDGEILISYKEPEGLLTPSTLDSKNELEHIELMGEPFEEGGKLKHLCKIGAATSNEQFRAWSVKSFFSDKKSHAWVLPLNVILVENTIGGTNAMMCHGAGISLPISFYQALWFLNKT